MVKNYTILYPIFPENHRNCFPSCSSRVFTLPWPSIILMQKINFYFDFTGAPFFRLCAILYDGTRICSPIYSINDYIEKTDLDELLKASALEEIGLDKISLHIRNKRLHVNTPKLLYLSIFDIHGKSIFSGNIQQSSVIPLDHLDTPIIIARYRTQNIIKTTKLQVQ